MLRRVFVAGVAAVVASALAAPDQPAKQLTVVKPSLQQYEDGPPLAGTASFTTGELVFCTFQVQGYKVSPESKIDLQYHIEAVDPGGTPVAPPVDKEIATQVSPEDKNWMPLVRDSFQIPPLALSGTYQIRMAVEDKLSRQKASAELTVPVRGKKVEPSDTLVARNFHFYTSEEGGEELDSAVYHPGDTIWGRFDIIGFKYGEKNHIHVEYGIALLGASGKTLYSQPQAAVQDDATFYPKRYLPGVLSLSLGKDFRPGEYSVLLTLRDDVGKQEQESRYTFRVE